MFQVDIRLAADIDGHPIEAATETVAADALRPGVQLHRCTEPIRVAAFTSHAWIWTDNPAGTFAMWNPSVHCDQT